MKAKVEYGLAILLALTLLLPVYSDEGELMVDGGEKMLVSGRSLILTGNMTVMDDSQLLIANSRIQLSIRGEKAYNTTILDQGKLIVSNSTLETLSDASIIKLSNSSEMNLINSYINGFKALHSLGNSTLTVQGGQLNVGYVECTGKIVSLIDGSMPIGELDINTTKAVLERFKGDVVSMNVNSSTLTGIECNLLNIDSVQPVYLNKSRVKDCFVQSDGEVVVSDSTFDFLTFLSSGVAINVMTVGFEGARSGGSINAVENVTVQRYWYLNVKVTDPAGIGIPARIVLIDRYNNTVLTAEADIDGVYMKPVLGEIVNGSKTVFIGNYKIMAEYLDYSTRPVPVVLDGNRNVELKFSEPVPLETTTTLMVSPDVVRVGDSIKIEGWINTRELGEYVQIVATGPTDSKFEKALRTGEDGIFKGEFKPHVEGQWVIYADWIGGTSQGILTKSQAFIVTVEPRPTLRALLIRAMPIAVIVFGVLGGLAFLALNYLRKSIYKI